ncbi:mycofactocin biosynthesis glycosyltransferase MftF [Geodermatophilus sp. DSM 45219]|uniref:mycofactocin biosynthesis glycosyltransferase MftF n=1 Tax=Geodermatophilus sp. DSM 45219 TaxID=1881103 RepID=UPI00088DF911|nr:mycofactocin biosynthesis glycosyltransferase MftF [Geodermatophilus sp. DSM 45219]SDO00590.1 mycofactocin system glycosyltransferase [Geodermatophilus sp. DSM 45219]
MSGRPGPTVAIPPPDRLPDGTDVRLDPRTRRLDDGATLLGGSPLRLVRLAPRAVDLLRDDRLLVRDSTTAALAARLLDAGLGHPQHEGRPEHDGGPAGELTVVVPVRDRPAELARLLAALRADPDTADVPVLVVDDGSADPAAVSACATAHGACVLRHGTARGPAAARNAGLRAATTDLVAFLDSDCVPLPGWSGPLVRHTADPRLAVVAPRITALPAEGTGWVEPYEAAVSALDMGPHPAPVAPGTAVSYLPSAALVARREALGDGFDEAMRVAEDVDLVWRLVAAGWRVRYEPAAEVAHEHRSSTGEWLRRRAFYGTGAALLAARHGGVVAPVVVSPWSAAAWALALTGRRSGALAAAAVLAVATGRLAPRLARPGRRAPLGLAAALVLRGSAAAGKTLARSVTRHHWPLALGAAAVSRRARRGVAAVAAADAVLAWWPHRQQVGPLRFAAGRRLEDLAYGAGLWAGALRARDPRALLPARPAPTAAPPERLRTTGSLVETRASGHDGRTMDPSPRTVT